MFYPTFCNDLTELVEPIGQQVCIIILTLYCEKFQTYMKVERTAQ